MLRLVRLHHVNLSDTKYRPDCEEIIVANLLHELLTESAESFPGKVAVQEKDRQVTYAELDNDSADLAQFLGGLGVRSGDRVGLLVHKSIEAYLGIYGIMKVGAAYVPIDRRSPVERIAYQIDDCGIETLLVTSHTVAMLDDIAGKAKVLKNIVCLDDDLMLDAESVCAWRWVPDNADENSAYPAPQMVDTDLAYILYTSGSTGQSKGVMISHAISMSFVKWSNREAGVMPGDHVSGHAPLHFDLSVFDIFATAMSAATLYPVPDGTSTFPSILLNWIVSNEISVWYSVPSILSLMAQQKKFSKKDLSCVRVIVFAGEVFPVRYLKSWLRTYPEIVYMNWFGPTETNVIASYTVTLSPDEIDQPVPMGKRTENAELFCVDESGNRVSRPGEIGELLARGPCVALGYWGDPEMTAQRFVDNFQSPWLKDRVCKTGDLVSLDQDGNYIYQGRKDHMIKSRGYRIELGEIEAALFKCPQIVDAVVVPVPDEVIGNRLRAFVELISGATIDGEAIRVVVSEFVPKYMIPESVQIEQALPKTSNGKVDRQALAKLAASL